MGGARRFGDHRAMSWIVTGMAIAVAVAAVVWALRQKRRGSVAAATAPPPDAPAPPTPAPGPVEAPAVAPRAARASTTPPASPSPRAAHASPPPPATAPPARSPRPHPVLDSPADEALAWLAGLTEEVARGATLPATPPADVPATAAATFQALGRVAARLDEMTRARAHIVATERDLERARKMYRSILPLASVGKHGQMRFAGASTPAAETGGDWWTYRKLTGERLLVAVGDATGHGVYSAMIGCAAHGAVEALSLVGEERMTPRSLLDAINAAIRVPGADRAAMTCFAALFDPGGTISFANASHMLPLRCATDAGGAITKVTALVPAQTQNLDDDSDVYASEITEGVHRLAPGELVVLFTDGLTDRRDPAGRAFGHRRLQQALLGARYPGGVDALAALRDSLLAEITRFADGVPADDDVTLILCAREPS
jgi:serine phosphatase RsbU (regulator of sigma subunit)